MKAYVVLNGGKIPLVVKARSVDELVQYTSVQPLTREMIEKNGKTFSFKGYDGMFQYVSNSHGSLITRVSERDDGGKWYSYTGWEIDASEFCRMFLEENAKM